MFAKHVSSSTSAYCHDELPLAQSRRVAEHLISCQSCRSEFEAIKLGMRFAAQLPIVEAPDLLWRDIEIALDHDARPVLARRSEHVAPPFLRSRFAMISLALLGLVFFFSLYWIRHKTGFVGSTWDVARLDGAPRIDSAPVNDKAKLGVGQWLETDTNSRARIDVGEIGQVEIDPNTRVRILETNPTVHRLELAQGRLSARVEAPPKLFFVNTPSGVAEDLGCAYTLDVDQAGNTLLRVTLGWVAFQLQGRESFVPAGAACANRPGMQPGTPYFEDASESFRSALTKVDFGTDADAHRQGLDSLLRGARARDTLTLWHLLGRVDGGDRARVCDRMAQMSPPPQGVTREGVLALDQQMLDSWKETLQFSWDDDGSIKPRLLRKVWARTLGAVHRIEGKR